MRTRTRVMTAVAALAAFAAQGPLAAQDAECRNLSFRGNFRLNGAQQYIAQAEGASFADQKNRYTGNALRVLGQAAEADGTHQLTLWFFYGRVYAMRGDLVGADSSFTRAEAALEADDDQCRREITRLRRNMWIPLQNEAVGQIQAQRYDSAIALLRKANLIFRGDPSGYMNMASVFLAQERYDSAAAAFRAASRAGTDPARADLRATALFNAARLYQRENRLPAAESAYREYIRLKPRDVDGPTGLAGVLTVQGRTDEASAIYDSLMSNADSLSSFELFDMGVALFRTGLADTTNAARQSQRYRQAARAFEAGLRKNPSHRDALFNLTNARLAANDTPGVLAAAQRLVAVDSLNRQSITLLARAQQMNRQQAEVVRTLSRRDSLPFEVAVLRFDPRDSTAVIRGGVQNLRGREQPGFSLVLEFLNGRGDVVATERVDIPALSQAGNPGSAYDFNITASGRGIVAYRYRIG